jgi:hypothetical protein
MAAMSTDTSWMLWNAQPPKLPRPRPGEPLFTLVKDHRRTICELRYHGEYGVEAQFLETGELAFSRRFDTAQAVQWAGTRAECASSRWLGQNIAPAQMKRTEIMGSRRL